MNEKQLGQIEDIYREIEELEFNNRFGLDTEVNLVLVEYNLGRILERNKDNRKLDKIKKLQK